MEESLDTNDVSLESKKLLENFLLQSKDFINIVPPSKFRKLMESVLVRGQRKDLLPLAFATDIYNALNQQKVRHLQQVKTELDDFELSEAVAGSHEDNLDIEFEPLKALVRQIMNLNKSVETECVSLEMQIGAELEEIEKIVGSLNDIETNTAGLNSSIEELKEKLANVEGKLLNMPST